MPFHRKDDGSWRRRRRSLFSVANMCTQKLWGRAQRSKLQQCPCKIDFWKSEWDHISFGGNWMSLQRGWSWICLPGCSGMIPLWPPEDSEDQRLQHHHIRCVRNVNHVCHVCSMHVGASLCVQVNETKMDLKLIAVSAFINANCLLASLLTCSLTFAFWPKCVA